MDALLKKGSANKFEDDFQEIEFIQMTEILTLPLIGTAIAALFLAIELILHFKPKAFLRAKKYFRR